MANYSFITRKALPTIENGYVFQNSNFCQAKPHTAIFEGVTGLRFEHCNLINCDVPVDAEVIDCNNAQISFCQHLKDESIHDLLDICTENCQHVVDVDTVTIDGILVDTLYHYENKVVS